jgi:hypothetical protein
VLLRSEHWAEGQCQTWQPTHGEVLGGFVRVRVASSCANSLHTLAWAVVLPQQSFRVTRVRLQLLCVVTLQG